MRTRARFALGPMLCALSFLVLVAQTTGAHAAGRASLVIDANTGQDLQAQDADKPLYPASLTKMMTLYIVFDMIEQKRISYTTRIEITQRAASQPPSNLELQAGATLTVREAVLALIVKSANDVACAIGENLAGTEDKFAQIMTAKARRLGMSATTYRNASGLPDPGQVTTARDMATLALRLAHDFPEHFKQFATPEFTYNGVTHRSHNSLLHGFEGTDGIKTGYTRASGFNLVTSVRRGQKHVIGVVFGGVTAAQRNARMRALLTQGLGRAKAMAQPLLVRRPTLVSTLVSETARTPAKPPVPRRVAQAEAAPVPSLAMPATASTRGTITDAKPAPEKGAAPPRLVLAETARVAPARTAAVRPAGAGRAPATLQDQAAGSPPAPRLPAPPAGLGVRPASGPFHVQIGAFSNVEEAQRQLTAISAKASSVLAGHAPLTVPVSKANVQFYRARFAGFSEAQAQAACQTLKQQKIECVAMRAE